MKYGNCDGVESRKEILKDLLNTESVPTAPDWILCLTIINENKTPCYERFLSKIFDCRNQLEFINLNYKDVQLIGIPVFSKHNK